MSGTAVSSAAAKIDFGKLLRPRLVEAVIPVVQRALRIANVTTQPLNGDQLAPDITRAVEEQIDKTFGVDATFWNQLSPPLTQAANVEPVTNLVRTQYQAVGRQIAQALNQKFHSGVPANWREQESDIRTLIENQFKAQDFRTKQEYIAQIDEVIRQSGVTEAKKITEARDKLLEAVLNRRDELAKEENLQHQFQREKANEEAEERSSRKQPEGAQQQQQQAEPSDMDSWLQQRKYQGQNLVVSMLLSLILSKGPINLIDYIGCIATGGVDGLLRKWRMLEYTGMTYRDTMVSEEFDPFHSTPGGAVATQNGGATQGYATAAQAQQAQAQQAQSQQNAGQAAASRPQPK